jgi:hypothetical protein
MQYKYKLINLKVDNKLTPQADDDWQSEQTLNDFKKRFILTKMCHHLKQPRVAIL